MSETDIAWGLKARPLIVEELLLDKATKKAIKKHTKTLLITGQSGSGKTTISHIIANASNAEILEINAGDDTGIGKIREIIDQVKFAPMNKDIYAVIIDEAHALSTQAKNALLKELENISDNSPLWMILTDQPEKLPATMRGRLNTIYLKYPSTEDLIDYCYDILSEEGFSEDEVPEAMVRACTVFAANNIRMTLNVLQDAIKAELHKTKHSSAKDWFDGLKAVAAIDAGDVLDSLVEFVKSNKIPNMSIMSVYPSWARLLSYQYFVLSKATIPNDPFGEVYLSKLRGVTVSRADIAELLSKLNEARKDVLTGGVDGTSALIARLDG